MYVLAFLYGTLVTLIGNLVHVVGMILAAPGQVVRVLGMLLITHAASVINRANTGRAWVYFPRKRRKDGTRGGFTWGRMR